MHLNYETTGNENGPALILVHGFLSSRAQWLPNIETLGEIYHLVTDELWGHGDSPLPDEDAFTLARYNEELEKIRADLSIERWGVIGQSYAAGLALRYAINQPDRTAGVVVTNSRSAFGDIRTQRRPPPQNNDQGDADVDTSKNRHLPIHPVYARRLPGAIKQELVDAADNMSALAIERGGRLGLPLHSLEILDDVPVPVLLTNGVFEKSFQGDADNIRQNHPGIRIVDLDGGHAVNIEAADQFNQAVLDFFSEIGFS